MPDVKNAETKESSNTLNSDVEECVEKTRIEILIDKLPESRGETNKERALNKLAKNREAKLSSKQAALLNASSLPTREEVLKTHTEKSKKTRPKARILIDIIEKLS